MKIREISERTGVTKRNIHFYIAEGLITPELCGSSYRFTDSDCERLSIIRMLREMGFSLQSIRAMLENPFTMGYYLTQQQHRLRHDIAHAERCVDCIGKMMGKLPLRPKYDDLRRLAGEAALAIPDHAFTDLDYDAALVNRVLWAPFIPDRKMTDYQEFLWAKLNRVAAERYAAEYKKIYDYFSRETQEVTNWLGTGHLNYTKETAPFGQVDIGAYSDKIIERLFDFVDSPQMIKRWIASYDSCLKPLLLIYSSELAGIVEEMSPNYQRHRRDVHAACQRTYDWLYSEDGKALLDLLRKRLGTCLDLDNYNHGQLEAMTRYCRLVL